MNERNDENKKRNQRDNENRKEQKGWWIIKDEGGWMMRNETDDERWTKDDGWDEMND